MKKMMMKPPPKNQSHPGFQAVASSIAKRLKGAGRKARAGAILASAARKASPKAKRANPRLRRVLG
jgi:hypothetical protein